MAAPLTAPASIGTGGISSSSRGTRESPRTIRSVQRIHRGSAGAPDGRRPLLVALPLTGMAYVRPWRALPPIASASAGQHLTSHPSPLFRVTLFYTYCMPVRGTIPPLKKPFEKGCYTPGSARLGRYRCYGAARRPEMDPAVVICAFPDRWRVRRRLQNNRRRVKRLE